MIDNLQKRLISYEPLWDSWKLQNAIYTEKSPNVYNVINRKSKEKSVIKVITINKAIFEKILKGNTTDFRTNLINAVDKIVNINTLDGCENFAVYNDALINEIHENNKTWGYDIIFRTDNLTCLSSIVKDDTKFTQNEVVNLLYDICNVLSVAHSKKIIHRYINLQSIFLDSKGTYKLGDFGIFRLLDNKKDTTYLAPEVVNGGKSSERSDIYSLGLIAYQLLNKNQTPDKYSLEVLSHVDKNLMRIVLKSCNNNATQRYSSINELIQDLNTLGDLQEFEPIQEPEPDIEPEPIITSQSKEELIRNQETSTDETIDIIIKDNVQKIRTKPPIHNPEPIIKEEPISKPVSVEDTTTKQEKPSISIDLNLILLSTICVLLMVIAILFGIKIYTTISIDSYGYLNTNTVQNIQYDDTSSRET